MIDQGELFEIPNPCRSICQVNAKGYCKGCFRSRQERFHWHSFTDFQKHLVVQLCSQREKRIIAAKLAQQNPVEEAAIEATPQIDLFVDPKKEVAPDSAEPPIAPPDDALSKPPSKPLSTLPSESLVKPVDHPKPGSTESQLDLF